MIEKNCANCKNSHHIITPAEWSDAWEKAYQDEKMHNAQIMAAPISKWTTDYLKPRFFWHDRREEYEAHLKRQTENIECRWGPNFVDRKKTDLCSQWSSE